VGLQVKDRVEIIGPDGKPIIRGTIININDYREPSLKYAVEVDGYTEDYMFFGENQLVKCDDDA
jgi:hypothetical protein